MSLIKCNECGTDVSSKAKSCPLCGIKNKRKYSVIKFAFGTFFVVIAYAAYVDSNMTVEQKEANKKERLAQAIEESKKIKEKKELADEKACSDQTLAFVMSQSFVKKRLKSPASANFPYTTDDDVHTKYLGGCIHEIRAYVDSQNSFGANIRSNYYVKLKNIKGTEDWQSINVIIK